MRSLLAPIVALALVGAIAGFLIGELAPDLFGGLGTDIQAALSDPFSSTRNEIAGRYALYGAGIGALVGAVAAALRRMR